MLLSRIDIANALSSLTGWAYQDNRIEKDFSFRNFSDALQFINLIGDRAEAMNHHPDMLLHDYKNVTIMITSHDAGGVTAKDFTLAHEIEGLVT